MPQKFEYVKLIGLLAFLAGLIKLFIGLFGYSFGAHYFSSIIILGIGLIVYFLGLIMQKQTEAKEE